MAQRKFLYLSNQRVRYIHSQTESASEQGCTRPSCRRLTALESAVAKGTGEMVDTVFPRGGGDGRAGADAKRPSPQIAEILGL